MKKITVILIIIMLFLLILFAGVLLNKYINVNTSSDPLEIHAAGTYGPQSGEEIMDYAIICADGVTLQNTLIPGNLYLSSSIGEGSVRLKNVTVQGTMQVNGGGENSVTVEDCSLENVVIKKTGSRVRMVAQGNTKVKTVYLESGAIIEDFNDYGISFSTLYVNTSHEVQLSGSFNSIVILKENARVRLLNGSVENLHVSENVSNANLYLSENVSIMQLQLDGTAIIKGKGSIDSANINATGSEIEMTPSEINLGENVSAVIEGIEFSNVLEEEEEEEEEEEDEEENLLPETAVIIYSIRNITITRGETETRTITTLPDDASITARSSNTNVAAVSVEGNTVTVTGNAEGQAVITIIAKKDGYNDASARFTVSVKAPVQQQVTVNAVNSLTVNIDESAKRTVSTSPTDAAISARCSNPNVAVVSVSGNTVTVTGIAEGEATITVTAKKNGYNDGTASFKVSVKAVQQVTVIAGNSLTVNINESAKRTIGTSPTDTAITATSSNPNVAVVSVTGNIVTVTGKAEGEATVTITAKKNGYTDGIASFKVNINKPDPEEDPEPVEPTR
ncbi:MAG: Ig-like domain-containing protein [Bacillota bacterium]|nr:Ig-like domain-containing protein [Bacillota bacterium]